MRPFAVFDIDGTFIRWQLFHAIVHSLGKHRYIPADAHRRIGEARKAWKVRAASDGFSDYETVLVKEYLNAIRHSTPGQYAAVVQEVFDEYKDQTYAYTRDLAQTLKAKGYFLLAVSGSHQEIIQKLAQHHGFDVAIGASLEQIDGKFSGRIDSPVFDKAKALKRLIREHALDLKDSIGVGDSTSDIPMLELVDNPIVFNPDRKAFLAAKTHRWKIVIERKNMIYELEPGDTGYTLKV